MRATVPPEHRRPAPGIAAPRPQALAPAAERAGATPGPPAP
ncbi:MAG: hypothetical protein JWM27_4269, partial [Gemmatimonadetes bacterium]|nr:hypothetical protein [Gemmatimonadota bacterium]